MELQAALIGGLIGSVVGAIVGGLVSLWVQRREHRARQSEQASAQQHMTGMAREERRQRRRELAYERIVRYGYQISDFVRRTEPVFQPGPTPPPPIPEDELRDLNMMTALHASEQMKAMARELSKRLRTFEGKVYVLGVERDQGVEPSDLLSSWQEVEGARDAFTAQFELLLDLAATELAEGAVTPVAGGLAPVT